MILEYLEPREMLTVVESEMRSISSADLFNAGAHKPLLERWCAAIFGLGYSTSVEACKVALNDSVGARGDIDFFVRLDIDEGDFGFQLTEVQEPGRRRGYECRFPTRRPTRSPLEDERKGKVDGPAWIRQGVQKKFDKYGATGRDLNLLVYADFATDSLPYESVASALADFRADFASIWIMDSIRICSIHSSPSLGEAPAWREARPITEYYHEGRA